MGQSGKALRLSRRKQQLDGGGGDDDVKRQVDSDVDHQKPIYQLVNVKTGGGKLIELIKLQAKQSSASSTLTTSDEQHQHPRQHHSSAPSGWCSSSGTTNVQAGNNHRAGSSLHRQHSERLLDEQIRALVAPLLYNEGRGKLVSLDRLWCCRMGRRLPEPEFESELGFGGEATAPARDDQEAIKKNVKPPTGGNHRRRLVCWKLEERGFVGETGLHICFLLSTPSHMLLAQRLLRLFPALINDIYTCDEYFGESSLHMAIVNENFKIVKLLLEHGANVHERCLGSFFLPADLKEGANGRLRRLILARGPGHISLDAASRAADAAGPRPLDLHSNHFAGWSETNFEGYAYWGEYPLSFAASLGLADCYRLLLAKGADPNRQDSLGNATLHLAVIADRLDMFDLCYATGASLHLSNKLNLSPLTLAARLRRTRMFFHILALQRPVQWTFCRVGFLATPLQGVDSIDTLDGSCNDDSVLSIVVSGNSNEHLEMLDGLVAELLHVKWASSTRKKFNSWLRLFLAFLLLSSVAYITRFQARRGAASGQLVAEAGGGGGARLRLLTLTNSASECLLLGFVAYYLYIILARVAPQTRRRPATGASAGASINLRALGQAPEVALFLCTCLLMLACLPLRLLGLRRAEDCLAAVVMFLLPLKLLFFCRASKSLGPFIVMIYKILMNDVLCFVVFLVIFVAGFSQSFLIIFKSHHQHHHNHNTGQPQPGADRNNTANIDANGIHFESLFDGVLSMHMMAWNEFSQVFDEFAATDYPRLARLLFCVYMILVSILLVNMLIAMLGKTYQEISSQPNENLRQWARASLTIERLWSNGDRLRALDGYSHLVGAAPLVGSPCEAAGGGGGGGGPARAAAGGQQASARYYSSTWALTSESLAEIATIRRLVAENRRNARRFEAAGRDLDGNLGAPRGGQQADHNNNDLLSLL